MSAEDALKFLMQMTKDVAKDYIDTKRGAGLQFSKLQDELGLLVARLKDTADMPWKDHAVVEKEKQVRELVYHVEDVIDTCLADKAAAKTKSIFGRIPGIVGTTMEVTVKDLRANKVAHALQLLETPNSVSNGVGSSRGLGNPKQGNSVSNGRRSNNATSDIESSYRALAYDRRVCLLYTALFPEDYISASTLTELWIAERFISQQDNETLEETATQLLNELITEKLLVAHEMRLDQVKTCRVEDRIRKFCKQKAIEENLFTVIESDIYAQQSFYRLCFHSDPSTFLSRANKSPNSVRSFICLAKVKDPINLDPQISSTIPNVFKPLRILKCESTKFDELPKKLTSLKLLKHITLWIDKLDVLPEELSKLSNLQTLIIKTDSKFITVKANIWKMEQLRHLKAKVFFVLDDEKWKAGEATNLQTITRLSSNSCTPALLKKAPNLKSLGIQGELNVDLLEKLGLEKFKDLEKLKLVNYKRYRKLGALDRLPSGDRFPLKLNSLTLSNTKLLWNRHMARVAEIDTLKVLKLKDNAFKGVLWKARSYTFDNLKLLLINNTDLDTWDTATSNFPLLECIVIKNCEQLTSVPDKLAKQVKKLENVPDSLVKQVQDSQTDASSSI